MLNTVYIAGKIIQGLVSLIALCIYHLLVHAFFFCPRAQGFRPEGEISRRHPRSSRVYKEKYLQLKYTVSMPEKTSISWSGTAWNRW